MILDSHKNQAAAALSSPTTTTTTRRSIQPLSVNRLSTTSTGNNNNNNKINNNNRFSPQATQILMKMLNKNPKERPKIQEILNSPWLSTTGTPTTSV